MEEVKIIPLFVDGDYNYKVWKITSPIEEFEVSDQEVYDGESHKEESFEISASRKELFVGEVVKLVIVPTPAYANVPEVIIESSDENVIKANGQASLIAVGVGDATVTVTDAYNTEVSSTILFTVTDGVNVPDGKEGE